MTNMSKAQNNIKRGDIYQYFPNKLYHLNIKTSVTSKYKCVPYYSNYTDILLNKNRPIEQLPLVSLISHRK